MIKLKCRDCDSDDICCNDSNDEDAKTFKCDECGHEFNFNESEWESE